MGEEEEKRLTDNEFDEEKDNVEHQQKRDPRRTRHGEDGLCHHFHRSYIGLYPAIPALALGPWT